MQVSMSAQCTADARIHIEHNAARRTASMDQVDLSSRMIGKEGNVLFGGEPSRLEVNHLARRDSATVGRLAADDPAPR